MQNSDKAQIFLFKSFFDNITRKEACRLIENYIRAKDKVYVVGVKDVALSIRSIDDPFLMKFYNGIDLLLLDGRGLFLASMLPKYRKNKFVEIVGAPDLYKDVLTIANEKKYSVFCLGARQAIIDAAVVNIKDRYSGIKISGKHHGYISDENIDFLLSEINKANPDLLLVGMATPYREIFIDKYKDRLPSTVVLFIGGLFDIEAGYVRRAPNWIVSMGFEWLFRVVQEPRRLGRRYLHTHSKFIYLLLKDVFTSKRKSK